MFSCYCAFVRTKIDLPELLFRELKAVAARRGTSLKNVIQNAVEAELRKVESKVRRRITFPLLPSTEPGTLMLKNADIEDLLA